ncbi:MAG: PASTA domain-containing protein [Anaerolineae bacterium]|nr:PASTA domain-containing protein [Chloroflexota bacterium]MBP6298724.1 PASTA domain-containing protein [Anaerolineae bacterium]
MKYWISLTLLLLIAYSSGFAQTESPPVPDVTGMTLPEAAATLNRLGFTLGEIVDVPYDSAGDDRTNKIARQMPDAGQDAEPGSSVNVAVLRTANARLTYDDNDLTLINMSAGVLDLSRIEFFSVLPDRSVSFSANGWGTVLDEGDCGQIWSIGRVASKSIDGCAAIKWLTTANTARHFWTTAAGVTEFEVQQDGSVRATCNSAGANTQDAPLSCDLVLGADYLREHTGYIYLAYTVDSLIIHNQTTDRWMDVSLVVIHLGGAVVANPADEQISVKAASQFPWLAPGQCLLISQSDDPSAPEPCDAVGSQTVEAADAFWKGAFQVSGRDGMPRACDAAKEGELTICIVPR